MSIIVSLKQVHQRLNKIYGRGTYKIVGQYQITTAPTQIRHKCGQIFELPPSQLLDKQKYRKVHCPACRTTKGGCVAKTTKQFQQDVNQIHGHGEYRVVGKYQTWDQPLTYQHFCGKRTTIARAGELLTPGHHCSCQNQRVITLKNLQKKIDKLKPGFTVIKLGKVGNYGGPKIPFVFRHADCGKTFKQDYQSFLLSKHCPYCAGQFAEKLNTVTVVKWQKRLDQAYGRGVYKALKLTKKKMPNEELRYALKIKHRECGKTSVILTDLHGGQLCSYCPKANFRVIKVQGHRFLTQGYEDHCLYWLLRTFRPEEIVSAHNPKNKPPLIIYQFGKRTSYLPDFYIPSENWIIEVKSPGTLGLCGVFYNVDKNELFERMQTKAKTCIRQGYVFTLYLHDGNRRLRVPNTWYLMSRLDLANRLGIKDADN